MDRKELEALNVHELRVKARVMGVKAPTTKRQSQLVDEILQIERGVLPAFKSNMGRPPKANSSHFDNVNNAINETTLANLGYGEFEEMKPANMFESSVMVEGIGEKEYTICGVIRKIANEYYVLNYLSSGMVYAIIPDSLMDGLSAGDLILGVATNYMANYGKMKSCEKCVHFDAKADVQEKAVRLVCKDIDEMYAMAESDVAEQKIIVEVEAKNLVYDYSEKNIKLYTKECDDIIKSYNMLLDVKSLVTNLCQNGKTFSIYFMDVEYIYSILLVYYEMKKSSGDINAGQYFKEILSMITNSKGAKAVMLQKETGRRSSYLDLILGKYCKM